MWRDVPRWYVCQVLHNIFIHLHNISWPLIAHLTGKLTMFETLWVWCVWKVVSVFFLAETVAWEELWWDTPPPIAPSLTMYVLWDPFPSNCSQWTKLRHCYWVLVYLFTLEILRFIIESLKWPGHRHWRNPHQSMVLTVSTPSLPSYQGTEDVCMRCLWTWSKGTEDVYPMFVDLV